MNTALIPKTDEPPQVDVEELDERIPTDEEIAQEMQAIGLVKMTTQRLALYQKLGIHQNGKGILKGQRGMSFLTQVRLNEALDIMHRLLVEGVDRPIRKKGQRREEAKLTTEQACLLAHEISFGTSKLTEAQEFMLKLRPRADYAPPPLPGDAPKQPVFPAGAVVVGAHSVVQIHQRNDDAQKPVEKNAAGS